MWHTLRRLASLFPRSDRRDAAVLLVIMLIATALEVLTISSIYPLVAMMLNPAGSDQIPFLHAMHRFLGEPEPGSFLVMILLVVFFAYLGKNIYGSAVAYLQNRFAFNKQTALARRLFEHYLMQPYSFHMQRNSAELIRNLVSEADQVIWLVFLPGVVLVSEGLVAATLVALLFLVDPLSALVIVAIFGVVGSTYYLLLRKRITRWSQQRQHHEGQRILRIQQALGGIKEVRILGREPYFVDAFVHHSIERARSFTYFQLAGALPLLVLEVLGMASLLVVVGLSLVLSRPMAEVFPFLGMVTAAAFRLIPASNRILITVQQLRYGRPIVDALYREFNDNPVASPAAPDKAAAPMRRRLRLENVAFRYPGRPQDVFSSVSLEIGRGQTVAIIGPSGAGKTTLIDLILGLLEPSAGRILVDDRDLKSIVRPWQRTIGYIPQQIYLTDESLRRNVAFGIADDAIDEKAIDRAVERAQLRELIASLPRGLDTIVGERGVRLSGGQLQRVGIARALYHDPQVLVLDEATSSLDALTEGEVMDAIGKLRGDKTILIIAHRPSTVEGCDLTLRVAAGSVVRIEPASAGAVPATNAVRSSI